MLRQNFRVWDLNPVAFLAEIDHSHDSKRIEQADQRVGFPQGVAIKDLIVKDFVNQEVRTPSSITALFIFLPAAGGGRRHDLTEQRLTIYFVTVCVR
jgi:hypothetical protein